MNSIKYCASCALRSTEQDVCVRTNTPINPNEDFCSHHVTEIKRCDLCGHPYVGPDVIYQEGENLYITCQRCMSRMGTCEVCQHGNQCDFQTNPAQIPHMIMQTVRQGPMTMQTQVKNPERIKITCEAGCPCWDPEAECCKEFSTCGNYNFIGF